MKAQVSRSSKLSTLDLVFSVMDSHRFPLDFTLLFDLKEVPDLEALRAGARSARNQYPKTGSYLEKKQWLRCDEPTDGVRVVPTTSAASAAKAIEAFVDSSFDLRRQMPVQQLVISSNGRMRLATRFHHAVADGLSAAMWLSHQLCVAYGKKSPMTQASTFEQLCLRSVPSSVKRSEFAFDGPSEGLWTRRRAASSGLRRWLTIEVPAGKLRPLCRRAGGFTYNDLLATCVLEVFTRWNRAHDDGREQKVGLWLPVNIRQQRSVGFGNGTSRIRLYARCANAASLIVKCRSIHGQVSWSCQHGEWAVPESNPVTRLPLWVITPLLRCYLNRPGVDMGTGVFSHAESWAGLNGEIFGHVEKIECIGLLHPRQALAINGATHGGQTWLTFTYDPGLFSPDDIRRLSEMYQDQIAMALRELS